MALGSAKESSHGRHRFELRRAISLKIGVEDRGSVLFVMLNPSTADATNDDPTIRRCKAFAREWNFSELIVGNLYSLRATDPALLRAAESPNAAANPDHVRALAREADRVVVAWGASAAFDEEHINFMVDHCFEGVPLFCLGRTKEGHPRHPLYVKADVQPIVFKRAVPA